MRKFRNGDPHVVFTQIPISTILPHWCYYYCDACCYFAETF